MCVCVHAHMFTHVCTEQYYPYTWAKSLCSGVPLAASSSPQATKYWGPQYSLPKWLWASFLSLNSGQVRYQCVYVPPAQGVAKGYDLKEEAWTLGQKEEGTKRVEQDNMLSLLLCVPAQRILSANPPVRVERWQHPGTRVPLWTRRAWSGRPWYPGAWLVRTGKEHWKSSSPMKKKEGVSLTDCTTIGREGRGSLLLTSHLALLLLSLHFPRVNNSILVENKSDFKFALFSVIWFHTQTSLFLLRDMFVKVGWYILC